MDRRKLNFLSKKIRYGLIILVLILVVAGVGVSVLVNSGAFRSWVVQQVNRNLDGRLTLSGHKILLFPGRLALYDIQLDRSDGKPLLQADRLEIQVNLRALLQQRIQITLVELDKPHLTVAFDAQDHIQLIGPVEQQPSPPETKEAKTPWAIIIENYQLNDGVLVFHRPSKDWRARAEQIQISGHLDLDRQEALLKLSAKPLTWGNDENTRVLPDLKLAVQYHGTQTSTIVLETGASRLSAQGRMTSENDTPALDVTADLDLALEAVRPWLSNQIELAGKVLAHATVRGTLDNPVVDLHINLPKGNLAGVQVDPLDVDLRFRQQTLTVSNLKARGDWGNLTVDGGVDLAQKRIVNSSATFNLDNLARLAKIAGVSLPSGKGRIQLHCDGPWARPTAQAVVTGENLKYQAYPIGRLSLTANLDASGGLNLKQIELHNQDSLIQGRGQLLLQHSDGQWRSDPVLDLTLDISRLNPADFGLNLPVQGGLNLAVVLAGTARHLQAEAAVQESRLQWQDQAFTLQGDVRWQDGQLGISRLLLSKDDARIQLQGNLSLREPSTGLWLDKPLIQADLVSENILLERLFSGYSGAVTVQAQVAGSLPDLKGDFLLTGRELALAGQPLNAVLIKGRLADNAIDLDSLELTVASGQKVQGRARYTFDREFEMVLNADRIDLKHFPIIQRAYPVKGQLALALKGHGTVEKPEVTMNMTVRQPELGGQPWDDFHLKAELLGRAIDLDADLNFKLKGHGQLDSGEFDLAAGLADADLSPYLAMAGGAQWGGRITGRFQASGNWHQPQNIQADIDISEAVLRHQELELVRIDKLQAWLQNGQIQLPPSRLNLMQSGYLNLSASGNLSKTLRMKTDGRLPLSALAPFADLLDGARGELILQAQAEGPLQGLKWQGAVDLKNIAMVVPGLDQEVKGVTGTVRITPETLTIGQVSGRMDNGRFMLEGQMALQDLKPAAGKLTVKAQALPVQIPETMDAVINGDLTFESEAGRSAIFGQLVLLEGTYYKDVRMNLLSAVGQPQRAESIPTPAQLPPWLAPTTLNVALKYRYPFLVDNNLAQLQITPDLKISGTLERPVVNGRAQVSEGEIIFRRKTFTVTRGVVDFINPYKIEPTLDIAAQAQIRDWLVSLNLSGTPERMVFKLSSDPAESENDILSLILLGRTSSELAGGQGGGQTTKQMLASLVATAWGEDVKKTAGVDILEVDTGTDSDNDDAETIQVTVGKRLSRRLTVKYEVETGSEEMVQRAVSEYRFLDHLLASGFQDSLGGYGGELLFRIEF